MVKEKEIERKEPITKMALQWHPNRFNIWFSAQFQSWPPHVGELLLIWPGCVRITVNAFSHSWQDLMHEVGCFTSAGKGGAAFQWTSPQCKASIDITTNNYPEDSFLCSARCEVEWGQWIWLGRPKGEQWPRQRYFQLWFSSMSSSGMYAFHRFIEGGWTRWARLPAYKQHINVKDSRGYCKVLSKGINSAVGKFKWRRIIPSTHASQIPV